MELVQKKAIELVEKEKITSIKELREREDLLNDKQKIGLKYYEDILKKIPRKEIDTYLKTLTDIFEKIKDEHDYFEIVGSYRRKKLESGDIDIIISNKKNNREILDKFINELKEQGILIEILSKGKTKSLTIARLNDKATARRIDFMYSPPDEFPFSTLYFTGSKNFNVVQRKIANEQNLTLNEHGLYYLSDKGVKQGKVVDSKKKEIIFKDEKEIFDYLNMDYKKPEERIDGTSAQMKTYKDSSPVDESEPVDESKPVGESTPVGESKPVGESTPVSESKEESKLDGVVKNTSVKKYKKNVKLSRKTVRNLSKIPKQKKIMERWEELKTNGITVLEDYTEKELYKMLKLASNAYYNHNKPIVSDELFDILKEYANKKYPDNEKFNEVGAKIVKETGGSIIKKKVKLPYYLASMNKIKADTKELEKYLKKYPGPKIITAKADGISAFYTTEGDKPLLATRGQATNGLDISHMIDFLKLPKDKKGLVKGISIRGELIIKKDVFEKKYKGKYKNPRNFVSGVVNSIKTGKDEQEKWKDIDFVGYEVIKPEIKPSQQIAWLLEYKVITIKHEFFADSIITNDLLSKYLVDWRESYPYEIDGIIIADDEKYPRKNENPKHALAFKMVLSDQTAEAKIIDVMWNTSKDYFIKPVAQIEPVNLKGVTIEYVTAINAKYVNDNKIGVGAIIELVRSGDVIPKIQRVIKKADVAKMPDVPWHWNETKVDAISEVEGDPGALQKSIEFFFKKLDIKGVGPGNVAKLIKANLNTIPKILAATKEDMLEIDGFKEKTVDKIYNNIHDVLSEASLVTIASATNIFKRGIGSAIIKNILDKYPDIFKKSKRDEKSKLELIDKISECVDKVSKKRAEQFVEQIEEFIEFMIKSKLEKKLVYKVDNKIDKNNVLYDKNIVFSGPRDKTMEEKLLEKGAHITSSVSKTTFAVLVKDLMVETTKTTTAKKLGIPILTMVNFQEEYL
jgi:NAD-dependent DNA ligase